MPNIAPLWNDERRYPPAQEPRQLTPSPLRIMMTFTDCYGNEVTEEVKPISPDDPEYYES